VRAGETTLLVDLDPQGSAYAWSLRRQAENPSVIKGDPAHLPELLNQAEGAGIENVLIDTAPHADTDALVAARVCQKALIPCRPSSLDLLALRATVEIVKIAKTPAAIVLNATPPRGKLTEEAKLACQIYNLPIVHSPIGHRIAFVHALIDGLTVFEVDPSSKASQEIQAVYKHISHTEPPKLTEKENSECQPSTP